MNQNNNRGRTFWDLIAEHPKMTFSLIIALLIAIVFLSLNKYSFKSSVLTLEPEKELNSVGRKDTPYIPKEAIQKQPNTISNAKPKTREIPTIAAPKDTVKQQVVNVTSNNQMGGITANQVTVGAIARKVDQNEQAQLLSLLPNKNEKITITCIMGSSEAFEFASAITDFLKRNGYTRVDGVNQSLYTKPVIGKFFDRDTSGAKIIIGSNTN